MIKIKLTSPYAHLPMKQTEGSSGFDLRAAIDKWEFIPPDQVKIIPCGFSLEIPEGFEGQIRSRSGLATENRVLVVNSPGTIDSDYRGEIKVALINLGVRDFKIAPGDRIAQIVFSQVPEVVLTVVEDLEQTERGDKGFGSTGKR